MRKDKQRVRLSTETCGPNCPSCDACVVWAIRRVKRSRGYCERVYAEQRNRKGNTDPGGVKGFRVALCVTYGWRFLTFCESHCRPSNRPSPVVAQLRGRQSHFQVPCSSQLADGHIPWVNIPRPVSHSVQTELLCYFRRRHSWAEGPQSIRWPRAKDCKYAPPGRSCLLANTSNKHSFISLSLNILCNSCFASSTRSRS